MNDQIYLSNTEALRAFQIVMVDEARAAATVTADFEAQASAELRDCRNAQDALESELSALQSRAASSDDDDAAAAYRAAIDDLLEKIKALDAAISSLEAALSRFQLAAFPLASLSDSACRFLDGVMFTVARYHAKRIVAPQTLPGAPSTAGAQPSAIGVAARHDFSDVPLPRGLVWVPLGRIDSRHLSSPRFQSPQGASVKADLQRVLQVFQNDVIGHLRGGRVGRDDYELLDRLHGRITTFGLVHPDSMAMAYDTFLGLSPIALSRSRNGAFDVTDGRHRITLARAMGWSHVPARVL